jgi:hypothetical protein
MDDAPALYPFELIIFQFSRPLWERVRERENHSLKYPECKISTNLFPFTLCLSLFMGERFLFSVLSPPEPAGEVLLTFSQNVLWERARERGNLDQR